MERISTSSTNCHIKLSLFLDIPFLDEKGYYRFIAFDLISSKYSVKYWPKTTLAQNPYIKPLPFIYIYVVPVRSMKLLTARVLAKEIEAVEEYFVAAGVEKKRSSVPSFILQEKLKAF